MKLGADVLLQIVEAVRKGIAEGRDISELLRQLDVESDVSTGTIRMMHAENPPQYGMGALPPKV